MRVAYVITQSDVIGGASIHLLDLATGILSMGIDVTVLVGGNGPLIQSLSNRGIHCISLKHLKRDIAPVSDYLAFRELRRHLKKLKPDIVHLHSSKAGVLGRLAARSVSIPTVFTAHGWAFTEGVSPTRRVIYRQIERYMARFSNRIITVSDYDRNLALAAGVGSNSLITTVHNGIPNLQNEPQEKEQDDSVTMIMVARFDKPKDHESVIRAVTGLHSTKWKLHLVGDGPTYRQSKELARRNGIEDKVCFPGLCDDVPERLARADIFILMSNWEGLPLSILEAMRASLPTIASNVGGVPETVDDGETGFLVPRGDAEHLRTAITALIQDSELRKKMGIRANEKFLRSFSFEQMLTSTAEIYRQLSRTHS